MENKVREAAELAEKVNSPEVWTELGKAYLDNNMPKEAIDSFIKARNPSLYMLVISVSHTQEVYEDLVKFLLMARQALKDQVIDNELIFAFAKCGDKHSADLENFIQEPNQADLIKVGDRCFDNRLF
jgi:clathrin heavy chain